MNVAVEPVSATVRAVSLFVKPGVSLSVVVTVTVWSARASKLSFERPSRTAIVIVELMLPSIILSFAPVIVMVCAVSQLAFVNVKDPELTVASPVSPEVIVNQTSESGWASKTTVKVSVPPASVTVAVVLLNV